MGIGTSRKKSRHKKIAQLAEKNPEVLGYKDLFYDMWSSVKKKDNLKIDFLQYLDYPANLAS